MNVRFAFSHNFGTGLDLYDSLAPTRNGISHFNVAFLKYTLVHRFKLLIIHHCCRISTPKQDIASACECDSLSSERNHSGYNFSKYMDTYGRSEKWYKTYHSNDKNKI